MGKTRLALTFAALMSLPALPFADANADSPYWEQKASLYALLPIGHDDIIFLGNSITDGGEFAELFGISSIKNRGISADVIDGVAKRLDPILEGKPKKIFLLIGINDVSHGLSPARIAEKYERLVSRIRKESPETKLYIQSIMPVNNDFGRYKNLLGREGTIPPANILIRKIAEENGCEYIDLWPTLADPSSGKLKKEFTNDGLHLTGAGYRAWTDYLRPFVTE